jgi:arylsulfatase A-like enzyme
MVYQHSMFATSCELAGVQVPKTVEFPSLADSIKGHGRAKHDAVFSYYIGYQRAVRTREHKLIVYPKAGVTQLFDLGRDPWETRNLAEERKYASLKKELSGRLRRVQQELGDDLPLVSV